jgi:hypothetical protein
MSEQPTPPEPPESGRRRLLPRFGRRAAEAGPRAPDDRGLPLGRLILGLVLVGIGVVWLLEALDVVDVSFLAVLPAALIVIGVVLVVAARTGRHSGLIALGIIIAVILTIASSFDIRLRGGVGDRTERPTTLAEVQREYHLSMGQLTIDLRALNLPDSAGTRKVKATVGMGQLTVRVPNDALVIATGHVGAGQVTIFGRQNSGLDVKVSERAPPPHGLLVIGGTPQLILDLSVGLGQIEVTR